MGVRHRVHGGRGYLGQIEENAAGLRGASEQRAQQEVVPAAHVHDAPVGRGIKMGCHQGCADGGQAFHRANETVGLFGVLAEVGP
jgi:hypothetical protein